MGFTSIREMFKARRQREGLYSTSGYWDSKAEAYQGNAVSMWPNNNLNAYYHAEQTAILNRFLPTVEGAQVLDLGCGTGRNSRYLALKGAQVLGLDFSARSIEIASRMSTGSNPRYRNHSLFELDYSAAYDVVISWAAITMACKNKNELLAVLKGVRKALKPGGSMLICEPIHSGALHRVLNLNLREFKRAMEEAGFTILETTQISFWPSRLVLAFVPWPKAITAAGYYLGRGIMALFGNQAFGDYKVIFARSNPA